MYSRPDIQHLKDEVVIDAIVRAKGSIPKAADEIGMHRNALKKKVDKSPKILAELRLKQVKGYEPYPLELDERIHGYIFQTNGVLKEIVNRLITDEKKGMDIMGLNTVKRLQDYLRKKDKTSLANDLSNARSRLVKHYSEDDFAIMLEEYNGNISLIAQILSVPYKTVWVRVNESEYLKSVYLEAQTKIYADAQHILYSKMHDPNVDVKTRIDIAKMVVLNHPQAKKDGWGKSVDVTSNGKDVNSPSNIVVEIVNSQTNQNNDNVIDVDIVEPKQIAD